MAKCQNKDFCYLHDTKAISRVVNQFQRLNYLHSTCNQLCSLPPTGDIKFELWLNANHRKSPAAFRQVQRDSGLPKDHKGAWHKEPRRCITAEKPYTLKAFKPLLMLTHACRGIVPTGLTPYALNFLLGHMNKAR